MAAPDRTGRARRDRNGQPGFESRSQSVRGIAVPGRTPSLGLALKLLELGSCEGRTALGFRVRRSLADADLTLIRIEHFDGWHIDRDLFSSQNSVCGTMIGGVWISGGKTFRWTITEPNENPTTVHSTSNPGVCSDPMATA